MDSLSMYFGDIKKYNLLTKEEEISLAKRIEAGDKQARDIMIQSNLRLVINIAKKYRNSNCAFEDLIQESSIGLIKAVERFDWRRGFKFSTYACWWIKQSIRKYIAGFSRSMSLPPNVNNVLSKATQLRKEYYENFGVYPLQSELAELIGVTENTLNSFQAASAGTVNLDSSPGKDGDNNRKYSEIIRDDVSVSIEDILDREQLKKTIKKVFQSLSVREEKIIRMRFGISESPTDHENFPITEEEIDALKEIAHV